jgi:hypothetical protein
MWCLLAIVAVAAAVLSFSALKDLGDLCGFHPRLSPLLPAVVDAGAAAGCLVWLSPNDVTTEARRFARALTWTLLGSSVAGNAIVHGLSAYHRAPHWTLVVAVSGVAPAVLGAVVHLSVLVGRDVPMSDTKSQSGGHPAGEDDADGAEAGPGPHLPRSASSPPPSPAPSRPKRTSVAAPTDRTVSETRAAALLASGAGRRKLARALDISEHQARVLLEQHAAEKAPNNGVKVLEDA